MTFNKIRVFHLNNNPVTRFGFATPVPSLSNLNIERAKLAALPDDLFVALIVRLHWQEVWLVLLP